MPIAARYAVYAAISLFIFDIYFAIDIIYHFRR